MEQDWQLVVVFMVNIWVGGFYWFYLFFNELLTWPSGYGVWPFCNGLRMVLYTV